MMGLQVISMGSSLTEIAGVPGGEVVLKPQGAVILMMILEIHLEEEEIHSEEEVEVLEVAIAGLQREETVEALMNLVIQIGEGVEVIELAIAGLKEQEATTMLTIG